MQSFSAQQIADWTGGRIVNAQALGRAPGAIEVDHPAELAQAGARSIAFFFSRGYQSELPKAAPSVLVTGEPFVAALESSGLPLWRSAAVIACRDPYLAMALILRKLAPGFSRVTHLEADPHAGTAVKPALAPSAVIDPSAELGSGVTVGPHCVVEGGAKIGAGTILYPGCYVGSGATIGERCVLFPKVTLYERTQVGDRVRIHAGAVIGADGFGYAPRFEAGRIVSHEKIHHVGRVVIGSDVEIGANSCIDRGTIGDTWIGDLVKIDDLVMIGHNCRLDTGAVICGNAGLAGRARIGKFAYIGGAAGVGNDAHIGDGAKVGALSVVPHDVAPGETAIGNPARRSREHFRIHALLNRMLAEHEKGR